jgi:excisionase family DNA binding protein
MRTYRYAPPSQNEAETARKTLQYLTQHDSSYRLLMTSGGDEAKQETVELTTRTVEVLLDILGMMASGQGVILVPQTPEVTTAQAADILNVSRPFVIKLLESGVMPYHKVGKHRRVRLSDVLAYKQRLKHERETALDELAADAQAHRMGYEE